MPTNKYDNSNGAKDTTTNAAEDSWVIGTLSCIISLLRLLIIPKIKMQKVFVAQEESVKALGLLHFEFSRIISGTIFTLWR